MPAVGTKELDSIESGKISGSIWSAVSSFFTSRPKNTPTHDSA